MGFWDTMKELAEGAGKAAMHGMAAHGDTDRVIEELRDSPKSRWASIMESAFKEAHRGPINSEAWARMFSDKLSKLEDQDPHFKGITMISLAVFAKIGVEDWANRS
jgi:hypothetical protein